MSLTYALYPNKVSKEKNVYRALIKGRRKITFDEIINRMVERHSGVTKGEAMGTLELFMEEVEDILKSGGVISTPLFNAQCSISGRFNDFEDYFHQKRHKVTINLRPGPRLKCLSDEIKVQRVHSNVPVPYIMEFTDMSSGLKGSVIKPGSPAIIRGKRLQFDADDANQGVFFINTENESYKVKDVFLNTFSQLYIVIPEALPKGSYFLEVRSCLKTKTLRNGSFGNKLTVE